MYRLALALITTLAGSLSHGAENGGLLLELIDSATGLPVTNAVVIMDDSPESLPVEAEIIQKNREFHPHVLVIPKDSKVDFPNRDNTQHHVYSFSPARIFDIELYAGRPEAPIVFDQTGIVEIGCNIHDQMRGFILVTDTDPSGRTNEKGQLNIFIPQAEGNAGESRLSIWHPRMVDNTRMAHFTLERPHPEPVRLSVELSPEPASGDSLDSLQKRFQEL